MAINLWSEQDLQSEDVRHHRYPDKARDARLQSCAHAKRLVRAWKKRHVVIFQRLRKINVSSRRTGHVGEYNLEIVV